MKAQAQKSNSDIRGFHFATRNCLFENENPIDNSMFQGYSMDNCVYECSLRALLAKNKTGCIPWDIPFPFKTRQTVICNGKETSQFKQLLSKEMQESLDQCEICLPSCESTQYDIRIDTFAIDPAAACRNTAFFKAMRVHALL